MIIARAPHRIPLGGGGTDLPSYYEEFGGMVLSVGIDKYVYVYVNQPAADDLIRVKYSRYEEVTEPDDVVHDLVRPTLKLLGIDKKVEIVSMADVPTGTGLGSSSSFVVALLTALLELQRKRIPTQALAELACHVEIDLAGHPVGRQDQYMAAFGGLTKLVISPSGRTEVSALDISGPTAEELQNRLLLFFTGMSRSANQILGQQVDDTARGDRTVIESLHATKELGQRIEETLKAGNLDEFGLLMHEHWETKKRRSTTISDPRIDRWYAAAREAGVLGGKVVGAGGGGFLLLYSPPERKQQAREALAAEGLREMPYRFEFDGAKVIANL